MALTFFCKQGNGSPPARAVIASSNFRELRQAYAGNTSRSGDGSSTEADRLGVDALAASGGQVVVGKESKFRAFYCLVNSIYVLGITSIDTACKGVDVTPDKVQRKYTEIYMALGVVLRGATSVRLATILSTFHGEGIPHMVLSATDYENRARGADSWNQVKGQAIEQLANINVLSAATFELPEETVVAEDEIIAT